MEVFKHFKTSQWFHVADGRLGKVEAAQTCKIAERENIINKGVLKLKIAKCC
jgi:hypothetical protein